MHYNIKIKMKDILMLLLVTFFLDGVYHFSNYYTGSNGFRICVFGLIVIISFTRIRYEYSFYSSQMMTCLGLFIAKATFDLIRGVILGQNFYIISTFIKGYIYILYIIVFSVVIKDRKDLLVLCKATLFIGTSVSIMSCICYVLYLFYPAQYYSLYMKLWLNNVIVMASPYGSFLRILFSGIVVQVMAFFVSIYMIISKNINICLGIIVVLLNMLGLYLSGTRGILGGTVLGVVLLTFLISKTEYEYRSLVKFYFFIGMMIVTVLVIFVSYRMMSGAGVFIIDRLLGKMSDTVESDSFRRGMLDLIMEKVADKPLFGGGLGYTIDLRDGLVELTYHDLWMKMGLLGMILFMLPGVIIYSNLIISKLNGVRISLLELVICCSLLAVFIASYSNPYLISSMGLFIYMLAIRAHWICKANG